VLLVGRNPLRDVVDKRGMAVLLINDPYVSSSHCTIHRAEAGGGGGGEGGDGGGAGSRGSSVRVILVDVGLNKTIVNGTFVAEKGQPPPVRRKEAWAAPWRWTELKDGDRMALVREQAGQERHAFTVALL
jgi:hypothetical protein